MRSLKLFIEKLSGWKRNSLAAIMGVLTTLCLAPYYLIPLIFISFPCLFALVSFAKTKRRAFADGWWFGFGFFVSGLYWFANALMIDPEKFGWLVPFAVFGLNGILAIYIGLSTLTFKLYLNISDNYLKSMKLKGFIDKLSFAAIWFIFEWLRGHLFTGFPWNLIGYVWTASDISIQAGWWFNIYALGAITVLFALLPLTAIQYNPNQNTQKYSELLIISLLAMIIAYKCTTRLNNAPDINENTTPITIRIVQGNIEQSLKWDPKSRFEAVQKYARLTMSDGFENIDYVVWPESAMTFSFNTGSIWAERLAEIVPPQGYLITGVTRIEFDDSNNKNNNNYRLYNAIQILDKTATVVAHYDKRKLVPFGEFVPFRNILPINKLTYGTVDFTAGSSYGIISADSNFPPAQALICYEAIFPELSGTAHNNKCNKAEWLLNVTNDAWFGDSSAPYQHLQMARMRAVEQGIPLIRAANTGISAAIDPYGRVIKTLPLNKEGIVDIKLPQPARDSCS